jgi:hypothetical protein
MTNEQVIQQGITKMMGLIDAQMLKALHETMWDLQKLTLVPIQTHNLWDSIGCGVYQNGSLIEIAFPRVVAERPQKFKGGSYYGREQLSDMIIRGTNEILTHKGWALYYVAAQPYAQIVDDRMDGNVLHDEDVAEIFLSNIIKL